MDTPVSTRDRIGYLTMFLVGLLVLGVGCAGQRTAGREYKIATPSYPSQGPSGMPYRPSGPDNTGQPQPSMPRMETGAEGRPVQLTAVSQESSSPYTYEYGSVSETPTGSYHIGPGDVLEIRIYQLLELEKEAILLAEVDRYGQIYLPLLNQVQVEGMTTEHLREGLIEQLQQELIRDPKVNVEIKSYRSKDVLVLGQVSKPGPVYLQSDSASLIDVLGKAGGVATNSAPDVEILRGAYSPSGDASSQIRVNQYTNRLLVPLSRLFAEEGSGQMNPVIYPGDVVKVRPADEGYIYMAGAVENPGSKTFRRPLTFLQAITIAGGAQNIANEKKCKLIRRTPEGLEKEMFINLEEVRKGKQKNLLLAQNDTVIVPVDPVKKFFDDLDKMIKRGVRTGVNATYNANPGLGWPESRYTY